MWKKTYSRSFSAVLNIYGQVVISVSSFASEDLIVPCRRPLCPLCGDVENMPMSRSYHAPDDNAVDIHSDVIHSSFFLF